MDRAHLLGAGDFVGIVQIEPAVIARPRDADQPGIAEQFHDVMGGKLAVALPLVDMGIDVFVDNPPRGAAQRIVLVGPLHSGSPVLVSPTIYDPKRGCKWGRRPIHLY